MGDGRCVNHCVPEERLPTSTIQKLDANHDVDPTEGRLSSLGFGMLQDVCPLGN
jgi:hypothetical protein